MRYLFVIVAETLLLCGATAQTVVNAVFTPASTEAALYSDPNNWSPAVVPNNTDSILYNVEVPSSQGVQIDVDATISNLTLGAFASLYDRTFTVTGTTMDLLMPASGILISSQADLPATFNAGTLSAFSGNTLRGNHAVSSEGSPATLRFRGANIRVLSDGSLRLQGALSRIVDENGNDALRNLARVESSASMVLEGHHFVTASPLTNDGLISVGETRDTGSFTAAAGLTNYDAATRTLRGGRLSIGYFDLPFAGSLPVEFRFNGADIVRNGSDIQLIGEASRITDLAGLDALRNLVHNLDGASLTLHSHTVVTAGAFTNDGRLSLDVSAFTVSGPLTNYDAMTWTLNGGTYVMTRGGTLSFSGADIVRNAASLEFTRGGRLRDTAGNNALRNFAENLESGSFTFNRGQSLTTSGNFTNAGRFTTGAGVTNIREITPAAEFTVASGFQYMQTAGVTENNGVLNAGRVNVVGGTFLGRGVVNGNVVIADATIGPMTFGARINGDLTLGSESQLRSIGHSLQVSGAAALAGTLRLDISANAYPASDAVYTVLQTGEGMSGTFANAPHGARVATGDGTGSFVVVYESKAVKLTKFQSEPPASQLLNISTRGYLHRLGSGDSSEDRAVLIGGFIIYGSQAKTVILRGIGPTLGSSGVAATLADPTLVLHGPDGNILASNDDWRDAQQTELTMSGLAPADNREAAILTTLAPGLYTTVLREKNGSGGTGLVEVYDLSKNSSSKLANISTRGFVDPENLLIGGVIAAGDGEGNALVVVRALGPRLANSGISEALADPAIELRDRNGDLVAANDDWSSNSADIPGELWPLHTESALRVSLPRGNYTAIVRGKDQAKGLALVEFYDLRR